MLYEQCTVLCLFVKKNIQFQYVNGRINELDPTLSWAYCAGPGHHCAIRQFHVIRGLWDTKCNVSIKAGNASSH